MDFQQGENIGTLIPHVMNGLAREELIGDAWASGNADAIKKTIFSQLSG